MERFQKAANAIKQSGKQQGMQKISNDQKLQLYGLFKQANEGDNTTGQPWAIQIQAKAKWTAWTSNKGKSKEQAANEYVGVVEGLLKKYGAEKYINF